MSSPHPSTLIGAAEATYLLTWANQVDPRVQLTDANADVWTHNLTGRVLGRCQEIIADHYGRTGRRGEVPAITAGDIRKEYQSRKASHIATQRAIGPRAPRKGHRMRRETLQRFQAKGILLDRNPADYPE